MKNENENVNMEMEKEVSVVDIDKGKDEEDLNREKVQTDKEKEATVVAVDKGQDEEDLIQEKAKAEKEKEKKRRAEKRRQMEEELHEIVASRIWGYINRAGLTQGSFAQKIDMSSSSVNRWLSYKDKDKNKDKSKDSDKDKDEDETKNSTSLPPLYKLKDIAQELGITVDSLLGGEETYIDRSISKTYSRAFLTILELSDKGILQPVSEDPFLHQLLYRKLQIDSMNRVGKDKKTAWMKKVLVDYDAPLLPLYLTQYIELFIREYEEIDKYDTYLSVFHLFQGYSDGTTKAEVDQVIKKWRESILSGSDEYKNVKVPWGGGEKLIEVDEEGNAHLVEKPKPAGSDEPTSVYDLDSLLSNNG